MQSYLKSLTHCPTDLFYNYNEKLKIVLKIKSINRRDRKEFTQRTQRIAFQCFDFATFDIPSCTLRLKQTSETATYKTKYLRLNINFFLRSEFVLVILNKFICYSSSSILHIHTVSFCQSFYCFEQAAA